MNTYDILLFSNKQCLLIRIFWRLGLIKPINASYLEHPLTNRVEGYQQTYETREWINSLLYFLCDLLLDNKGREAMLRLENCGYIASQDEHST